MVEDTLMECLWLIYRYKSQLMAQTSKFDMHKGIFKTNNSHTITNKNIYFYPTFKLQTLNTKRNAQDFLPNLGTHTCVQYKSNPN